MASIMEVLTKTALAEITKLVDDAHAALRLEICTSQRENEALKSKLMVMEGELGAARGCGEGTPDSSLNIAFEVKVCDEFREAQNSDVAGKGSIIAVERVFDERLSTGPAKDEQYVPMEKKKTVPVALEIKHEIKLEPVDGEQDWSESVLLSEDWLEEDPKTSQSQSEQKICEEDAFGTSGADAANGGEGPPCEKGELHMQPCPAGDPEKGLLAELKQEPERETLTPRHPLPGYAEGLEVQCALSKDTSSGNVREMLRQHGAGSEHGGARSNDRFSPRHLITYRRLRSEKNEGQTSHLEQQQNSHPRRPPDGISNEMAFHLGSRGERVGSTLCEESFGASAEAEKLFYGADSLQQHHLTHHGGKRFSCTLCVKGFTAKSSLKSHKSVHTGEEPHICDECGKSFAHLPILESHQSVHTEEKPHSCDECGKSFAQLGNLKTHQSVHTGVKTHSCDECGKSFAHLHHLKTHQRVHTGEKPHHCDKCGKSFAYLHVLKSHQSVHTGEKPYSCNECGKSFAQLGNLKTHQIVHSRKMHSCDVCGKSFAHLHHLKTHQRVHTGEKPHRCDKCGKSFAYLHVLKSHQSVHTGEKTYSCNDCGKSFGQLCNLKTHQSVHTGEKLHSCDKCGKNFAYLCNLKSHQILHTGEKPHRCNECGKSFAHLRYLKSHQSVHTREKPHSCDKCEKSFVYLCNLKTHQRVHTGEKPFSCSLCGRGFSQNHVLQRHIVSHTKEKKFGDP